VEDAIETNLDKNGRFCENAEPEEDPTYSDCIDDEWELHIRKLHRTNKKLEQ
jgi:hypothetical protein